MALNKKNRLKKKKDFEGVFKQGKAVKGNFLFVKYRKNGSGYPRIAFIVSSKVSRKAVVRNRIRRILSDISRTRLKELGPVDIILIADKKIIEAPREKIEQDLESIFRKLK
ncbi:MAG: ribonuclease P protein component [Candidatus Yanofskybacteria bacterium]|nr:ribonuclease P protein component [Candidatus Yanofskybacteria bacterium]